MTALHSTDSRFDSIVEAYTSTDALHREIEAHEETRALLAEALLELERRTDPDAAVLAALDHYGADSLHAFRYSHRGEERTGISVCVASEEKLAEAAERMGVTPVRFADDKGQEYVEASVLRGTVSIRVQTAVRRIA